MERHTNWDEDKDLSEVVEEAVIEPAVTVIGLALLTVAIQEKMNVPQIAGEVVANASVGAGESKDTELGAAGVEERYSVPCWGRHRRLRR